MIAYLVTFLFSSYRTRLMVFICVACPYFSAISQINATYNITDLKSLTKHEKKIHFDSLALQNYLKTLQIDAYSRGFLTFSIDTIRYLDSANVKISGSTGSRFRTIQLEILPETTKLLKSIGIQPRITRQIKASPREVSNLLTTILETLDKNGYPFAKVGLRKLTVENETITSELIVVPNNKVLWKKLHVIGKAIGISEKFIANYIHFEVDAPFSNEVVVLLPMRLKQITYLKETKPAELLFTPEGAELYVYLESKPVSLFNGTVGLQQDPIKKTVQLTGDLRLKLLNVLKRGELFDLNWRSIQAGTQQLKITASYPYLFNTPFGLDGQFQLFKRDTTFLELKSTIGVNYFLSSGNTLKAFYRNGSSNLLGSTLTSGAFGSVKTNQYGLSVTHQEVDYLPCPQKGLIWLIEASAGQRTVTKDTLITKSLVFTGKATLESYIPFGKRNVIKLAVVAENFYTEDIQQNELNRFGGNLSQRGFLEDELLSTTRATATAEYRFLLDRNSYLFAFFDQTWYEQNITNYSNDSPYGFGAGLSFGTNIGIFSLTYALGSQLSNPILVKDSKIHFGYVAFF